MKITPSTILSKALDFSKRVINPIINEYNYHATKLGQITPINRFKTITDQETEDYIQRTEKKRISTAQFLGDKEKSKDTIILSSPKESTQIRIPTRVPTTTAIPTRIPTKAPLPTSIPTATLTPKPSQTTLITNKVKENPSSFDFTGYKIRRPDAVKNTIPQPPEHIGRIIHEVFDPTNEANAAAVVAWSENGSFNPNAVVQNYDPDTGEPTTKDYGIMQINSGTFDGLRTAPYWKDRMAKLGINSETPYTVLLDPEINIRVAGLVHEREMQAGGKPFSWWYGWQGKNADGSRYLGKDINLQEMLQGTNRNTTTNTNLVSTNIPPEVYKIWPDFDQYPLETQNNILNVTIPAYKERGFFRKKI